MSLNPPKEKQNRPRFTIVLLLLSVGIVITALSASLFTRMDQIVNNDLYGYGLQFDYNWYNLYLAYSRLMLSFQLAAIIVASIAMVSIQFSAKTGRIKSARLVSSFALVVWIVLIGSSVFLFNKIDHLIHGDLYRYGLQFNVEWASRYWTCARTMTGALGLATGTTIASTILIVRHPSTSKIELTPKRYEKPHMNSPRIATITLLVIGIAALAFSIYLSSSVLAFTGLSLIFWGAILLYIRPERYVKERLVVKATISSLAGLHEVLQELGYKGKGIYLPQRYAGFETSKVYIHAHEDVTLPSPEQIRSREDRALSSDPGILLITPPGAELARLFEQTLHARFKTKDLEYLEQHLPSLLIEDLEIVDDFEMTHENGYIHVKMATPLCENTHDETEGISHIRATLGCPLCSAVACTITEATGQPLTIEREQISKDGKTVQIEYRLLGQQEEKT